MEPSKILRDIANSLPAGDPDMCLGCEGRGFHIRTEANGAYMDICTKCHGRRIDCRLPLPAISATALVKQTECINNRLNRFRNRRTVRFDHIRRYAQPRILARRRPSIIERAAEIREKGKQ